VTRRGWSYFFDHRLKLRRLIIIWEAFATLAKAVYTQTAQIFTSLGPLVKASAQYAYSAMVKPFVGNQVGAKAQATYTETSATLKGRPYGLVAQATYTGTSALLKGSPYGLVAKASYSAQAKVGATTGVSTKASYVGTSVLMKGSPTGFRAQAQYSASSRQYATSGTKFSTSASYSASAAAQVNPSWLPKFDLSTDKSTVNTVPGGSYTITFTVTNMGGLSAQAEVTVWDVDGTLKDQFTVSLDPGASYSKSITFTAPQDPGTYYITAQVMNLFTSRVDDGVAVEVDVASSQ